jgi:hypothetical protein
MSAAEAERESIAATKMNQIIFIVGIRIGLGR